MAACNNQQVSMAVLLIAAGAEVSIFFFSVGCLCEGRGRGRGYGHVSCTDICSVGCFIC